MASTIVPIELRGALRRRVEDGRLDVTSAANTLKRVATDRAYWTLVEVGREVLSAAEVLIATHPLRTLRDLRG